MAVYEQQVELAIPIHISQSYGSPKACTGAVLHRRLEGTLTGA